MSDQYTVELAFNRPPEDIKRMGASVREAGETIPQWWRRKDQQRSDLFYVADLMDEIASKMEG